MADRQDEARRLLAEGLKAPEIARRLGVHKGTVNRWLKEAPPVDMVAQERRRAEADRQRKEHVSAVKELAFRDFLAGLVRSVGQAMEPPPPATRVQPARKGVVEETMLLNVSDWHAAEFVRPEAVFGLNEYSQPVLERRVARIVQAVLDIKARLERGGWRFPRLVVAANGDMVSGTIHEVERHTDAPNIVRAVLRCGQVFAGMLRDLSAKFSEVHVFCTSGNHGRLPDAKKVQSKEPTRSWDYLIYQHAAALLRNVRNVRMEIPDSWAVLYEIEGKLFHQAHGHMARGGNFGGIPFYGLSRHTSRLGSTLAKHFRPVDYWLYGHFHLHGSIENAGGEYIINPCLIGPQEFGTHSYGDATPPGQLLCGVHPKHGITHRWRLAAEDVWPPPGKAAPVSKVGHARP